MSPHRHDIRLPGFDYSSPGAYHVTLTLRDRAPLFGKITASGVELSKIGRMMQDEWAALPSRYVWCSLDDFVVMPDHLHGILILGANPLEIHRVRLGTIIGAYKSLTTNQYIHGVKERGWPRFNGKLWLENYYERTIRHDLELQRARE